MLTQNIIFYAQEQLLNLIKTLNLIPKLTTLISLLESKSLRLSWLSFFETENASCLHLTV